MALEVNRLLSARSSRPQKEAWTARPALSLRLSSTAVCLYLGLGSYCPLRGQCRPPKSGDLHSGKHAGIPFLLKSVATPVLCPSELWL